MVSPLYSKKGFLTRCLSQRNFTMGLDKLAFGINRKRGGWGKILYLTVLASRKARVCGGAVKVALAVRGHGSA